MSERTEEASAGTSTSTSAKQRVKEWVGAVQVTQSEKERIAASSAQNLIPVINCLAVLLRAVQMKPQNRIPGRFRFEDSRNNPQSRSWVEFSCTVRRHFEDFSCVDVPVCQRVDVTAFLFFHETEEDRTLI